MRQFEGVIKQVNSILELYSQLPHPKRNIDKLFLSGLQKNGLTAIEREFVQFGESEIERMGLKLKPMIQSCRESVYKDLEPLRQAFKQYETILNSRSSVQYNFNFSLQLLEIEKGHATLTEDGKKELELDYSIFVETKEQAALWDGFLELQTAFNRQIDRLHAIGYQMHPLLNPLCSPRGIIYEGEGCYLEVRADFFPGIQRLLCGSKKAMA